MSNEEVYFDKMREHVRTAFDGVNIPDAVKRIYLVRNMLGKVRISVSEELEHGKIYRDARGSLRSLARKLGGVMGAHGYLPDDETDDTGVLFVSEGMLKLLDKEARPMPDLPGVPPRCVVYWAERLVTGSDWWITPEPADPNRPPKRWTLFGAKGGLGRTTTAVVLAWEYARKGERVLVVDLDLESPGLSSAMLDADARPEFGVTDWFVEDLVGQGGAVVKRMTEAPDWAGSLDGEVWVAPAYGAEPGEYLAKLGRVYMSSGGEGWSSRLERMLSRLEDEFSPTLILIESRNGLHDIAAATVTDIGADVLLFAAESHSNWEDYRILFQHWRDKSIAERIRDRLHIVSAMTPPDDEQRYLNGFREHSWQLFEDNLYDPADATVGPDDRFSFDLNDEAAPHNPLVVYWNRGLAPGVSLRQFDRGAIGQAYRLFLNDFESRRAPG